MSKDILLLSVSILFLSRLCMATGPQDLGSGTSPFVKHFDASITATFDIGASLTSVDEWSYQFPTDNMSTSFTIGLVDVTITLVTGLTMTFLNSSGEPTVRITGTPAVGKYNLSIKAKQLAPFLTTKTRDYVLIFRKPIDIIFVLDRSGSMECDVSANTAGSDWPGCIATATGDGRWGILKNCINNFASKLDEHHTVSSDRFAIVYFSGQAGIVGAIPGFINWTTSLQAAMTADMTTPPIQNTAAPVLARDGTSIGAGLFEAIKVRYGGVASTTRRQIVLLFTDGEQNTGRWVGGSGLEYGKIITPNRTSAMVDLNLTSPTISNIEIYTIGTASSAASLLQAIADTPEPGQTRFLYVMPGEEFTFPQQVGTLAFNEIYNKYSPQLLKFKKKDLSGDTVQFTSVSNKKVNRLFFEAYFDLPIAQRFKYVIEKNGIVVTPSSTSHSVSDYITTYIFDFNQISDISPEGSWTIKVSDLTGSSPTTGHITFFATADDDKIKFTGAIKESNVSAGKKIHPTVTFAINGNPVTNAEVRAIVKKSGDDIGDLLARTAVPPLPPATTETGTIAAQKYDYLRQNHPDSLVGLFQVHDRTVLLTHQGNGEYAGEFSDVDVTGIYKIMYSAKTNHPDLGVVERVKEETIYVRFAPPNLNPIGAKKEEINDSIKTVTLKPYFKIRERERFVGPGFEHSFGIFDKKTKLRQVVDRGDGSYDLTFSGNLNSRIQLFLTDEIIYRGKVKKIDNALHHRLNAGIHTGFTFPMKGLEPTYKNSTYIEGNIGYQLSKRFSLEGVFGKYNFEQNFSIRGGTIYLCANIPKLPSSFFLAVGIGGGKYSTSEMDNDIGFSSCLSLNKTTLKRLTFFIDGAFFLLSDLNYSFVKLGLGAKYSF